MANWRVVVLALGLGVAPAAAQEPPVGSAVPFQPLAIAPGARVRLSEVSGGKIHGYLAGTSDRALMIALPTDNPLLPPQRLEIPYAALSRVEVSLGKRHFLWLGALVGAVAIGATGFAEEVDPDDCGYSSSAFCSRAEAVAASVVAGALIGGTVGFFVKQERWTPIALEALGAPPQAGKLPEPPALTAGVALRF